MGRKFTWLTKFTWLLIVLFSASVAAGAEEFYKGKTMRIVVGASPGGGLDAYARAIARHIGNKIPGNPTTVVENMPGAGSQIAASYLYAQAKPDGLTLGHWIGGLIMRQAIGDQKEISFDARKFEWLGVPVQDSPVCMLTKASGVTSLEKWLVVREPLKLGGTAPGGNTDDIPRVLKAALGLPLQVVDGYKGTAEIRLAAEGGELAGGCWAWESIKPTWAKALQTGEVNPIIQALPKKHPDLSQVANAIDYAKTEEARNWIQIGIHDQTAITRPFSLPPGTPKERVALLRQAFMRTLKDPEFLAEAQKAKLAVNPLSGEETEKIVAGLFQASPEMMRKLKDILYPK
jgi:tripartite-type tricarboxylate transporter receptor subunit TctC